MAPRSANSASRPPPVSCDSVSRAADEHLVELFGERRLFEAFEGRDARPASFGLDLEARPLGRCRLSGGRRVACCCFQSDRRRRVVATRRLQLGAQRRGQGCCRFPAQGDALAAAAQAVERGRRLLAGSGRVGELFLGAFPLGDERVDLPVERAPLLGRRGTTPFGLGAALCQALEVERRDRRLQAGDLDPELLGALGGGRLERERPQPLLDFFFEIARAIDLDRDPGELQLGPVPAPLEPAEAGRFLDQLAPLGRLRVEHGLDTAL